VVDTTPKGIGAANRAVCQAADEKAIFQGGEPHELTDRSFVAQANYSEAVGQQFVRVVSCNTTAIVRVLNAFKTQGHLRRARLTLIRRGTDPWESDLGDMINTLLPEPPIPSHQGPDALTLLPGLDLVTIGASGPFNLAHVHFAVIETPTPITGAKPSSYWTVNAQCSHQRRSRRRSANSALASTEPDPTTTITPTDAALGIRSRPP